MTTIRTATQNVLAMTHVIKKRIAMIHVHVVMQIPATVEMETLANVVGVIHANVVGEIHVNVVPRITANAIRIVIKSVLVTFQKHPVVGMTQLTLTICCIY